MPDGVSNIDIELAAMMTVSSIFGRIVSVSINQHDLPRTLDVQDAEDFMLKTDIETLFIPA